MRSANAFLAVSEFIKQQAIARGFPAHKLIVHYIGIDTSRFQPSSEPSRQPLTLFVGRLVQKKGLRYLITAMGRVQAEHPDAELVVVGDGPLRSELEAQAAATLRRYRFVGALPSDEVNKWYRQARLFCAPSVTADTGETEGLPITVLEAQAMALPVISTMHSGIPEAITHDQNGLLAREHDADALAHSIAALLSNPERARRLGAAARSSVLSRFDMQRQTALLEQLYGQLVSDPSRVPSG